MGKNSLKKFYSGKVIIVTGASSGIGRGLALVAGELGAKVVLAARNKQALEQVAEEVRNRGGEALVVQTDVTRKQDCLALVEQAKAQFGKIDILINNAGISMRALFNELKIEVFEQVMNINFMGTVYCSHAAVNEIIRNKGWIVGISSIAGVAPLPARTAYSASKFAMYGFLITLRAENIRTGLHTLIVHPGFTASNIRKRALVADGSAQGETPRKEEKMMTPEQVAWRVYKAIKRKKMILVLTAEGKFTYLLHKCFPRLSTKITYIAMKREPESPLK